MLYATIPHLFDICTNSIVYRIWTHQDIYENWSKDNHWQLLESKVYSDVENLPLPKLVTSRILSIVKPTGRHFFGFLSVWLTKMVTSEKWLTRRLLSNCLTLYGVGIINQRKTALELLRSKTLSDVIAFRLACINFLEGEVLRLWPLVFRHFLNKIVYEHQIIQLSGENVSEMILSLMYGPRYRYGCIHEPCEVLFWIGYCLSKERGTHINVVPHYTHPANDWNRHILHWASISGDIPCFEYFINSPSVFFNHEDEIRKLCLKSDNYLISFFYHVSSLKTERKEEYFRKFCIEFVFYFLQWPLSLLFLDLSNDHKEMCDMFLQLDLLDWLFVTILEILHGVSYLGCKLSDIVGPKPTKIQVSDVYCTDHLEHIWTALWKVSPEETKSRILDSFIFTENLTYFLKKASHQMNFDATTVKKELQSLFLLNGKAVLMFLEVENFADALENVTSKYMPERNLDFRLLQLPQFPNEPIYKILTQLEFTGMRHLLPDNIPYARIVAGLHLPVSSRRSGKRIVFPKKRFNLHKIKNAVTKEFVNYIQEFLLWENSNHVPFCNRES